MAGEAFRLWPATDGPGAAAVDTTGYSLSNEFEVTAAAKLEGFFWWCANGASTTPKQFQAFLLTGPGTGFPVDGTLVTSGTLTQNAWNFVPLVAPVPLTVGVRYRAVVYFAGGSNWYSATSPGWATGIVNGLLSAPSNAAATGNIQSGFRVAAGAIDVPNSSVGSNYWVDVLVRDASLVASLGVASSTDAAQPVQTVKRFNLGVAVEQSSAKPTLATKLRVIGAAATEDIAEPLATARRYRLGVAGSQDAGRPLLGQKRAYLGVAQEVVSAGRAVGGVGVRLLLPAETTDKAYPVTLRRQRPADVLLPGTSGPSLTPGFTGPSLAATATTGGS